MERVYSCRRLRMHFSESLVEGVAEHATTKSFLIRHQSADFIGKINMHAMHTNLQVE